MTRICNVSLYTVQLKGFMLLPTFVLLLCVGEQRWIERTRVNGHLSFRSTYTEVVALQMVLFNLEQGRWKASSAYNNRYVVDICRYVLYLFLATSKDFGYYAAVVWFRYFKKACIWANKICLFAFCDCVMVCKMQDHMKTHGCKLKLFLVFCVKE